MNFYRINRGLNKRLHNYFSYQARKVQFRTKIKNLIKNHNCKPLSKNQIKEIKEYYASFGFKNISTDWHKYYTHLSGKYFKEYIPEDLFYNVIIPNLNMVKMHPALTDKNLLSKLFKGVKQPETVIKNINGIYYDEDVNVILNFEDVKKKCLKYSKLIIKPSLDSGGGKNVIVFDLQGDKTDYNDLSIDELINLYEKDFIIQNYLVQHDKMNLLNPSSVNTIRSTTLIIDGEVEFLKNFVRIGGKGSIVDNINQGGICSMINSGGILSENGFKKGAKLVKETENKINLKDFKIPHFNKILKEIKSLHKQIPQFKLVSWDIAVDKNGCVVLIEINVFGQSIEDQYIFGPAFGKHTDNILNSCKLVKFSDQVFR